MERRELLKGVAAATVTAVATAATAGEKVHDHHHEHSTDAAGKYASLLTASAECVHTGEAYLAHCLVLLGEGDKQMAACAQSVNELMAVCTALERLAGQQSRNTPKFAKLVADVCDDCEKQCRKHEKHAQCKACADACAGCSKECKKVKA